MANIVFDARQKFYVLHLRIGDPRRQGGYEYEIQVVDSSGLATEFGLLRDTERELTIDDKVVPLGVIEAARRQPLGKGDFVDCYGAQVLPKDLAT